MDDERKITFEEKLKELKEREKENKKNEIFLEDIDEERNSVSELNKFKETQRRWDTVFDRDR